MESQNEEKLPNSYIERISLNSESLALIDGWISQLSEIKRGFEPSRKQILMWLITRHLPLLSKKETEELIEKYFDEEQALKFALKEVRLAKARGEKPPSSEILKAKKSKPHRPSESNEIPEKI